MSSRLVIIGLDGVRLDLLYRFRDSLPTIGSMLAQGASGPLKSVLPGPHSGPAWTSFSTGLNPGKHGIGDWRVPDGYAFRPASGEDIKHPRFWDYLSREGYTSGIYNIPLTHPPTPIDGVLVTSWTSAFKEWTYPSDFHRDLESVGYRRKADFSDPEDPIENLFESIEARRRGVECFLDQHDWNLLVGMFYETEQAHHQFATMLDSGHPLYAPEYESKLRRVYEKVDEQLAILRDRLPDDTTYIVMSDHGFCPLYERVYVNRILQDYGHYEPPDEEGPDHSVSDVALAGVVDRLKGNDLARSMVAKLIELPLVGGAVQRGVGRYQSVEYRKSLEANWAETTAFNGYEHGGIFINSDDFPEGSVPAERKESVIKQVIGDLRGDRFLAQRIDGIYRREELFEGDCLEQLPEIIIDFSDGYLGSSGYHDERSRGPTYFGRDDKNVGFHTMEGVFIADGPSIRSATIEGLSILDIAPTALHHFDEPVPENMDGTPADAVFEKESEFRRRDTRYRDPIPAPERRSMTRTEQEAVETRLQEMGYM